ncbi:MAG: hypothetical protein O2782_16535 [bacterium]|nr:hypothetical protein [bacterium]
MSLPLLARQQTASYPSAMLEHDWTRHLLPLPKHFHASGTRRCARDSIGISVRGGDEVLAEAAYILHATIGTSTGPHVGMTIELLLVAPGDADAGELTGLPNAAQAYQITSASPDCLRILALQPAGILYGAQTLAQLLGVSNGQHDIEVPHLEVIDWPDLEERGLWNFPDPADWIPWMASMKLNYGKMAATVHAPVVRDTPGSAVIDTDLYAVARRLACRYMPFIVHLNFLHDIGLFTAYPELAGQGDAALAGRYFAHKQGNQHRAPCASQPMLVALLSDWLVSIADQGADEISCWLSERPCQCQCRQCTPVGQFLLESRAFVAAWRRAQGKHANLSIRIFSSTTTPEQDDRILAELPPEVKFERACATTMDRVRSQPRDRFSNPLIDAAAAAGRWVASYDVPIGAFGNVDTPEFKVPQYSAQRIRDFVTQLHGRGYAGAYGMLAWGTMAREVCGFAICALAEFSWNGRGRSIGHFAAAWATREALPSPSTIGRWAELLGEVEFDLYDSGFPMCYSWGLAAQHVEERRAPRLGEGLFRHFTTVEHFDEALESCDEALRLIEPLCVPRLLLATRVAHSYVTLTRAIWNVSHHYAHADPLVLPSQHILQENLRQLRDAGAANVDAIRAWRSDLGPAPWHHRVHDAIAATQQTVQRIDAHIRERCLF